MNSFLLTLGIGIAMILIAAFVAPFFIDWSSYRTYFEARAGEIIGRPVTFDGDLTVRLVPYPSLVADNVRIGGPGTGEGVERIDMRAALTPLLSGELEVTEFTVVRPDVILRLDAGGRINWADDSDTLPPIDPDRVVLSRFEIVDGSFTVDDERSGGVYNLGGVNLTGSAASLLGPFKVEGGGVLDGDRYTIRLATGRAAEDGSGMRFKASILPAARPLDIQLDGALLRIDDLPVFDGRLIMERPGPDDGDSVWRLDGQLVASPEALVIDRMSVRLGTEARNVSLSGAANVRLGADPRFDAVISARQIDFDRTIGSGPDAPVSPQAAIGRIGALLDPEIFPLPGHLALDVESLVLSGGLLEKLSVDLEADGAVWSIERATVSAPGKTSVGIAGSIGLANLTPEFDGAVRLKTDQATVFANWMFGTQARLPRFAIPAGRLDASGQVRLDESGMAFERAKLRSDDSEIEGSVTYSPAREGVRGAMSLALAAERLEFPDMGTRGDAGLLGATEALLAGLDLELQLRAGALLLGAIEATDVSIAAVIADGDARIDELVIGDIGGARISGGGEVLSYAKAPDGNLGLEISAQSLDGVVEALDALGAPQAAKLLAERADVLVPTELTADIRAMRTDAGSTAELLLTGSAGGTILDGRIGFDGRIEDWGTAAIDITLAADNPDGARLAVQIGMGEPNTSAAPGRLSLTATGRARDAVNFSLETAGIGIDGSAKGSARWPQGGGREVTSEIAADVADAESLLALAGIALPAMGGSALRVTGTLSGTDDIWRVSDLVIADAETSVTGELTFDLGGTERIVGGALRAERIELGWLMTTLLGPQATAFPDVPYGEPAWPSVALIPVEKLNWRGRIDLTTPAFGLFGGLVLTGAETAFSFDSARMSLEELRGDLFGGRMVAGLDLVDGDGIVDLSGRVDLSDARLEEIAWHDNGRAVATGATWAGFEFNGRGRSLAAIVSSLSAAGSFRVADGVLRRFNANAFDQIVSAADAGLELTEERVRQTFAGHLDSGSLTFDAMEGAFAISSGVLRASNIRIDAANLKSFASATIDLPILGLDSEWTLQVSEGEDGGRTREVGVIFAGPIASPDRQIDVNPLLGYLTVRAFEQEVERLEALQAEILERQRLSREMIRQGQERGRRARDAENAASEAEAAAQRAAEDQAAEQLRAAEEQARQAEERAAEADARRQAEETARRQAEQEARRAAEEAARVRAEEDRQRALAPPEAVVRDPPPGDQLQPLAPPLAPPSTPTVPTLPAEPFRLQPQGGSATTLDDGAFKRRIEEILQEIPSAGQGSVPSGGVMAPEPGTQTHSIFNQSFDPEPAPGAPQANGPPFNAPLVILPQPAQPVPLQVVPQSSAGQNAGGGEDISDDERKRTFR